jgi:uncharacterized protein
MATGSGIDYEQLQQDAMRGIVRAVLKKTAEAGALPSDHHFYISFLTQAPGVIISKRLREKYPQEMTIVLQHRFWDLIVTEERFEVKLTFDGIPERLVVPFAAIRVFIDPSVRFGLQFEDVTGDQENLAPPHTLTMDAAYDGIGEAHLDSPATTVTKRPRAPRKPKSVREAVAGKKSAGATKVNDKADVTASEPGAEAPVALAAEETAAEETSAKIVSLDQFRKK